jgi:hypothetical protein
MQFSLSGSGKPAEAKKSLQFQANALKNAATDSNSRDCIETVEHGIESYLDEQKEDALCSVSVSVFISVRDA